MLFTLDTTVYTYAAMCVCGVWCVCGLCPELQNSLFPFSFFLKSPSGYSVVWLVCVCQHDGGEGCYSDLMNPSAFRGHSSSCRQAGANKQQPGSASRGGAAVGGRAEAGYFHNAPCVGSYKLHSSFTLEVLFSTRGPRMTHTWIASFGLGLSEEGLSVQTRALATPPPSLTSSPPSDQAPYAPSMKNR